MCDFFDFLAKVDSNFDVNKYEFCSIINQLSISGEILLQIIGNVSQTDLKKFFALSYSVPLLNEEIIEDLIKSIKNEIRYIGKGKEICKSNWIFRLISVLFQENVLSFDLIKEILAEAEKISRDAVFLLCCNILPYSDNDGERSFLVENIKQGQFTNKIFKRIAFTLDSFAEKNWERIKDMVVSQYFNDGITKAVINDDIDLFIKLTANEEFDFDRKLENSGFEIKYLEKVPNIVCGTAFYGSIKCFKYLMLNNVSFSSKEYNIAKYSVAGGNIEIVKLLCQKGVDFSGCLMDAALYRRVSVFQWILNNYSSPEIEKSAFLYEITTLSIKNYSYRLLSVILTNFYPKIIYLVPSILFHAVEESDYSLFDLFIRIKENQEEELRNETKEVIKNAEKKGECLLAKAASNDDVKMMKQIIKLGYCDLNEKDSIGETALHKCAIKNSVECTKLLLSLEGIDVNPKTASFTTPLHHASRIGHYKIAKLLLEHKDVKADAEDRFGMTPFIYSVLCESVETISLFLGRKDVCYKHYTKESETALSIAKSTNNAEVIKLITPLFK